MIDYLFKEKQRNYDKLDMINIILTFILSISVTSFNLEANDKRVIVSSILHKIELYEKSKKLYFKDKKYKTSLLKKECSEHSIEHFLKKIKKLNNNNIPIKDKSSISLIIFGEKTRSTKNSKLSKYIKNLKNKILTLKKQVKLSCKS